MIGNLYLVRAVLTANRAILLDHKLMGLCKVQVSVQLVRWDVLGGGGRLSLNASYLLIQ